MWCPDKGNLTPRLVQVTPYVADNWLLLRNTLGFEVLHDLISFLKIKYCISVNGELALQIGITFPQEIISIHRNGKCFKINMKMLGKLWHSLDVTFLLQLTKPDLLIMSQMSNKFRGRFSRAGQSHQRPKLLLPLHCHSLMILPLWNLEKAALQPALHLLSRQKEGVGPMAKGKYQLCLFSFTELTGSLVQWNPLTSY